MASPVLTGTDNPTWPVVVPAGQWSPWITAIGTDLDARTLTGTLTLKDEAGNESNTQDLTFTFPDPLRAVFTFAAGVTHEVQYDPENPMRFRVRNANA